MSCGIYKITNKLNQHAYIGQSQNIEKRWSVERSRAFTPSSEEYNKTLSKAFRKYGLDSFDFEILELCSVAQLDEREKFFINLYNTYYDGYNETLGGNDGEGNYRKLSKTELLEIYDLLQNTSMPQKEIAEKFSVGQDVISTINHGKSRRLDGYSYPLRNNRTSPAYCVDCGVLLKYYKSKRCPDCAKKQQRKVANRPTREELKSLIRTTPFTQIANQYGVTDNTIRKWCIAENLPSKKKDIVAISDEEWLSI